jgi:hypothetical protein
MSTKRTGRLDVLISDIARTAFDSWPIGCRFVQVLCSISHIKELIGTFRPAGDRRWANRQHRSGGPRMETMRAARRAAYSHIKKRTPGRQGGGERDVPARARKRPALELERTAAGRRAASLKPHRAAQLIKARCRLAFLSGRRPEREEREIRLNFLGEQPHEVPDQFAS